jgi:hypothetical protein
MSYSDKGEVTREYYRQQGEVRERERIIKIISDLSETFESGQASIALDLLINLKLMIAGDRIKRGQAANHDLPS